jgi:hypothetical protein
MFYSKQATPATSRKPSVDAPTSGMNDDSTESINFCDEEEPFADLESFSIEE